MTGRQDITFAVNYTSQFPENPKKQHWTSVMGILYNNEEEGTELKYYSDAELESDLLTRRSTSGIVITFNRAAII